MATGLVIGHARWLLHIAAGGIDDAWRVGVGSRLHLLELYLIPLAPLKSPHDT